MPLQSLPAIHRIKSLSYFLDQHPAIARCLAIGWVVLIGIIAFLWKLGAVGLVDETEPLFAEAARQMTVTGNWLTPYFNGDTRFDKPPLIYWLMAIAYQTFGVNEFAARLPSALAAIALTAVGFYTLRQFGDAMPVSKAEPSPQTHAPDTTHQRRLAAYIGTGAIALNLQTIVWGRTGVSDMLLTGCMGTALFAFFCGYAQPHQPRRQARWYLSFYVLSALAVLAKGPVGIVVPGLIIVAFVLYTGTLGRVLREMQLVLGSLIFLGITLPWYILIVQVHGRSYIANFFGYHNVERFTSVVNNHSAPWYFYFLVVLLGFIPWSIHLPMAIARIRFWQRATWLSRPRSEHLELFALIWFVVIFGFFSISVTKLPSYTLPLLPAAAVLVALLWSDAMTRSKPSKGFRLSTLINAGFMVILAGATVYSVNWLGDDPVMPTLPTVIADSGILWIGGGIWLAVAIAHLVLILRKEGAWLWVANLVGISAFSLLTLMPALNYVDELRQQPLRQLATTIVQVQQPTEEIIMVGFMKPSVVFYAQRPVTYIYSPNKAIAHIRQTHQNAAKGETTSALILGAQDLLDERPLDPKRHEILQ
ncbi:MAG: glycosyltransferase family 39 protein, partial [Leptolyngbyaceae bacterium]|nr:glycosyltransferase family 39 protein [Leptolyngbyaceae bacterium]